MAAVGADGAWHHGDCVDGDIDGDTHAVRGSSRQHAQAEAAYTTESTDVDDDASGKLQENVEASASSDGTDCRGVAIDVDTNTWKISAACHH